jgi:hypothetical protein
MKETKKNIKEREAKIHLYMHRLPSFVESNVREKMLEQEIS